MGCSQGKTSQPTAKPAKAGSENTTSWCEDTLGSNAKKSPTLLGSEDKSSSIKDPMMTSQASVKIPLLIEETEANETYETLAGSTSTEPESEMPAASPQSPRSENVNTTPEQEAGTTGHSDSGSATPARESEKDHSIQGAWNVATIAGTVLTFNSSGETVDIQIPNPKECRMVWKGISCTGVLRQDGRLQWSDGDVWSRDRQSPARPVQTAEALANEEKLRQETLRKAAEQNTRSMNLPAVTAADVRRAGEVAAQSKVDASGNAAPDKPARKERQNCCC